jgi:hypothetical protein
MKEILKYYKWEIILILSFIVFTFIFPIKKISVACATILGLCLFMTVSNDERIKEPYGRLFIIMALGIAAYFYRKLW